MYAEMSVVKAPMKRHTAMGLGPSSVGSLSLLSTESALFLGSKMEKTMPDITAPRNCGMVV